MAAAWEVDAWETDAWAPGSWLTDEPGVLNGGTIAESSHTDVTADLSNSASASGATGSVTYQWKRKVGAGSYSDLVGETGLTLSDTGLTPEETYTYKRTATDDLGSDDSNEVVIVTDASAALSGGTIGESSHDTTSITLLSAVNAHGGVGTITYQWQRKIGAGAFSDLSGATSATLSDSGLIPNTQYSYKRTATDDEGSEESNTVIVTTSSVGVTLTTVTKAFTAAGVGSGFSIKPGQSIVYSSTGTFTGQLRFARSKNEGASWETVEQPAVNTNVAGGTVKNETNRELRFRFELSGTVTGTATTVISDAVDIVLRHKTPSGFVYEEITDVGVNIIQDLNVGGDLHVTGTVYLPGSVVQMTGGGVPTDGTTGAGLAGKGSTYTDVTNGKMYINGGTISVPAWKIFTSA